MIPVSPRQFAFGLIALCFGAIAAALILPPAGMGHAASQLDSMLALARRYQTWSWMSLALLQLIAVMGGVVPASLVGMVAGAMFGVREGFAISSISTLMGALAAFCLSRSLFRPVIRRLVVKRAGIRNFDLAIGDAGWKLVFLLRVSPMTPFAATSYFLGLSRVTLRDYMLGTLAAMPPLLGYVALGALAENGLSAAGKGVVPLQWAILSVGFAATALVVAQLGMLVARAARGGSSGRS